MTPKEIWEMKRENLLLKLALIEAQVLNQQAAHQEVSRQLVELGETFVGDKPANVHSL